LTLVNCTVTKNQAYSHPLGGGLFSPVDGTGQPMIKSSIFSDNSGSYDLEGPDIYGTVQSADYNLIKDLSGATVTGIQDHHIPPGQDPALGDLKDNGGRTPTHALQMGSPAIDAGSCEDALGGMVSVDQRGRVRPQGLSCDIGAYEFPGPHLSLTKDVNTGLPSAGERITYTIAVENTGDGDATGGTISDTLPISLSLAGPVELEPPTAGTVETLPTLASGLTILAGKQITVTFPVTVVASLATPTTIANTATIVADEIAGPISDSRSILVVNDERTTLYLPMVVRASR